MERAVVVGSSPEALRAAALLAGRGVAVRYLGTAAEVAGVPPEPPWGLGAVAVEGSEDGASLARVWGDVAALDLGVCRRGVLIEGTVRSLPLRRRDLPGLLGAADGARAAVGAARARLRQRLGAVLDLDREVRTYGDWIRDALGAAIYERIHRPYAEKRYGADPELLAPALAWWTHGRAAGHRWLAPARGAGDALAHQRATVLAAGGDVLDEVRVDACELDGGRVTAVLTDLGREHVDRPLFVDASPRRIAGWLPAEVVDDAWRFDVGRLDTRHAAQVTLPVDGAERVPWDLHVVDPERPFWRVTRPGLLPGEGAWSDHLTVHLTLADDDPAWTDDAALVERVVRGLEGLARPVAGEAVVQRLPDAVPVLRPVTQPSLLRRLEALDRLGVVGVGPRGAFRAMGVLEELRLLDAVLDGTRDTGRSLLQREAHRTILEGPVRLPRRPDLRALMAD